MMFDHRTVRSETFDLKKSQVSGILKDSNLKMKSSSPLAIKRWKWLCREHSKLKWPGMANKDKMKQFSDREKLLDFLNEIEPQLDRLVGHGQLAKLYELYELYELLHP